MNRKDKKHIRCYVFCIFCGAIVESLLLKITRRKEVNNKNV